MSDEILRLEPEEGMEKVQGALKVCETFMVGQTNCIIQ